MTQRLGATGLGLPLPQNLYPSALQNSPLDISSNRQGLSPGDVFIIPPGEWLVNTGMYCIMQFLDPVTGQWVMGNTCAWQAGWNYICSDGTNVRIANLLLCPVSAFINNAGGSYVQSTTTITATGGTSTWLPIIGGQLSASVSGVGAGYGIAPIVPIPPPPGPTTNPNGVGGVPATGYAVLASGTVTAFSFTNPGAGYPTPFTVVAIPSPFDPNINVGITAATIVFSLTAAGSLVGVHCTNPGSTLANATGITLAVAGAGTNATVSANILQTITTASVTTAGVGFGPSNTLGLTTVGGIPPNGSISANPDSLQLAFRPRPAQVQLTTSAGGTGTLTTQNGTIIDGGLFLQAPAAVLQMPASGLSSLTTASTIALTMGARADFFIIQPAP